MLQLLSNNKVKIIQLIFLVGLFAIIRAFENQLFYDPFLNYFKAEKATTYPEFDSVKLYFSLFLRYFLNAIISIAILYVIFKDFVLVKFSVFLFSIFFIMLLISFFIVLNYFDESHKMILFYIRRFLIQPVFILLFIPGFYFQKQSDKKITNH
ncbi:exosortase F system-associated membrane protein [Flavobacterium sp.]|uniref:exosortase F system-associated membrane protein n=1 Tax=Flavobacterium sp. TaxID=239 RepID=UPI00286EA5E0|nr:exosortase F system-associated protein [Flavobacterium sp.]